MSVNVIAFFCEDIRREANRQLTLVGTLPDTVNIQRLPAVIPKLGVIIRIHISEDERPKSITAKFSGPNTEDLKPISWNEEIIAKALAAQEKNALPFLGFIGRALAVPFRVNETGVIKVVVTIDGKEFQAGVLKINLVPPTALPQPSEQSQSVS